MTKDETIEPNEAATFQGAKVVKKGKKLTKL